MPLTVEIFMSYVEGIWEMLNAKLDGLDTRITKLAKELKHRNDCHVPVCNATIEEELEKSLEFITMSNSKLFPLNNSNKITYIWAQRCLTTVNN